MCFRKGTGLLLKRPLFSAAIIQLLAVLTACGSYKHFNIKTAAVILILLGIFLLTIFLVYIRYKKISVINVLMFIIYPITIINVFIYGSDLDTLSGVKEFNGIVADINIKEDYSAVYLKKNNISKAGIILYTSDKDIRPGDTVSVLGKISSWESPRNEGNFDSRSYYVSSGFMYKCDVQKITILNRDEQRLETALYKLKLRIKAVFKKVYEPVNAGLMESIVLGDKYEADNEIKELYQKSGISHLLAISGLHISIAGMSVYKLLRKRMGQAAGAFFGIIVIIMYLMLVGNPISAVRAACMLVIAIMADVRARTCDLLTALSIASIFQVSSNPFVVYNISYIMSFLAVIGIVLVKPCLMDNSKTLVFIKKKNVKVRTFRENLLYMAADAFSFSVAIQLATLPAVLYYSYQISIVAIILNCIVIPLMPLVMASGIITGFVGLFSINAALFFAGASNYILNIYTYICNIVSDLKYGIYVTGRPEIKQIILYAVVILIFIIINLESVKFYAKKYLYKFNIIRGFSEVLDFQKYLNAIAIFVIVIAAANMRYVQKEQLVIKMLDVGQGDCIYMHKKSGETYLFDGGSTDIKKVGKYRIYPAIRAMGKKSIDYVFISHSDADHINGIEELIDMCDNTFSIKNIVMPDIKNKENDSSYMRLIDKAASAKINVIYVKRGDKYAGSKSNGLDILCLHPCKDYDYEDVNDYSAVYRVSYDTFSILMTGDAGMKAENCMIKDCKEDNTTGLLMVNVLKTGHHGSKYSTSQTFLEYVKPSLAIISSGVNNRYNHPHKELLERLYYNGIKECVTNESGSITIKNDESKMSLEKYLQ